MHKWLLGAGTYPEHNQIRVVADIARRRSQVNDRSRLRAGHAKRVHVGHNVVAALALLSLGQVEVDVVLWRRTPADRSGKRSGAPY